MTKGVTSRNLMLFNLDKATENLTNAINACDTTKDIHPKELIVQALAQVLLAKTLAETT